MGLPDFHRSERLFSVNTAVQNVNFEILGERLQEEPLLLQCIVCWEEDQNALLNIWFVFVNVYHQIVDNLVHFRLEINFSHCWACTRAVFQRKILAVHSQKFSHLLNKN